MNRSRHWLLKTEPDVFSFKDLLESPGQTTLWEGVRNYQARNFMREMRLGDAVLIYHSNTKPVGVVGRAEVMQESRPDPTQFDPESPTFDPKAAPHAPRWLAVEVRARGALPRLVTLQELKDQPTLQDMHLVQKGSRLSVTPLTQGEFERVLELAGITPQTA